MDSQSEPPNVGRARKAADEAAKSDLPALPPELQEVAAGIDHLLPLTPSSELDRKIGVLLKESEAASRGSVTTVPSQRGCENSRQLSDDATTEAVQCSAGVMLWNRENFGRHQSRWTRSRAGLWIAHALVAVVAGAAGLHNGRATTRATTREAAVSGQSPVMMIDAVDKSWEITPGRILSETSDMAVIRHYTMSHAVGASVSTANASLPQTARLHLLTKVPGI